MKNPKYFLLALIGFAGFAAGAGAQDAAPEPIIVPYDLSKPIDSQKPDRVYISHERFLQLWEAAKANSRGFAPEQMAQSYILSSARYDAKLVDGALHVTGVIEIQTFNEGWVSVPLNFNGARLGVLKLDGQAAPLASGAVAIEKAGHHRIEAEFDIPVAAGEKHVAWNIPKTAGTLFSITLPNSQMKAAIQPGDGEVERIDGGQKIVTAALGSTDHVELMLDSSVGLSTMKQAAVAKIDTALSITPAVEIARTQFDFSFPESQQDHFTVTLDKALSLVKLAVPNLKSWKLTVGNDTQTLDITLTDPARESFKFSIDAERSVTDQQRHFPFISAGANRVEETAALFTTPFLDVTPQPAAALRQTTYTEYEGGLRLVAAFTSTGDRELLAYGVAPAKASDKAAISYVYLVNHSKIELVAALKMRIKNATLFDVTVGLPGDFTVQAVESDRLKDWWREGDVLHVRFKGNAPDAETPLVLHLVKLYKTTPDALEITPLKLPDAWEVEGNGIIAASTAVRAQMTIADAKEMNPENAATDFRILPPMERKRGFSFKGQNFHASVKLETLPPRVDGTWVMSAQAHESWVSVSTHVNLSARQGSAPGVSFRLPDSTPEARITGENVRETTSAVAAGWRVYQVAFQNDLTDKTDFTVDFDLPGDTNVALPSFEFVGVERTEGFVIVDNASEYEMQVNPSGLDTALSEQIPFLPGVSRNASLYRAVPGWALQISVKRLEKEAGRTAFVEYADLSTAIRADGSEWHKATYHLENRSLQFLPVKLPAGAELASVSIATGNGVVENVRADRGTVDGKEVLLVPLIKTRPGDTSYDVNLVYRNKKDGGLWTFSRKSLADPEIMGISVERTFWHLYLPPGSSAGQFGGNMDQVVEEVNETEKLQVGIEELRRLQSVVTNAGDAITAQNAEYNYRKKADMLQQQLASAQSDRDRLAGGLEDLQMQQGKDMAKKQEVQKELAEENKKFEQNQILAQQAEHDEKEGQAQQGRPAPAPAPAKRVVTQTWADNGAYVARVKGDESANKTAAIDRQQAPQGGNQLYVNDYVVNVSSANTYTGSTTLGGNNTYNGGTTIAAGNLNFSSSTATVVNGGSLTVNGALSGSMANSGVLELNGGASSGAMVQNKVAEIQNAQALQRQGKAPAKPSAAFPFKNIFGGGQVTTGLRSGGQAISGEAVDSLLNPGAGGVAVGGGAGGGNASGNVTVLSDARANAENSAVETIAQQQQAAQAAEKAMPPAAADAAAANTTDMEHGGDQPGEAQLPQIKNGAGTYYSRGLIQGPAQLQTAGAISLPVDFPTDGLRAYHFQKLNTNARLTFWITNAQGLDKWKRFAVFALMALLVMAVFRFIDRGYLRMLRRRVVHI